MKEQAKTVLRRLGLLSYTVGLRRFFTTIKTPKRYNIEFASCEVSFLTDRPYTKEWFHRNRKHGAYKGWHEPSITFLLESLSRVDSTFVDVGSHLGYFSILFSSIAGNRSLAIELDPSNFEELQRAVAFQPIAIRERITILHCGVSDAADTIALPAKGPLSPSHSIATAGRTKGHRISVDIITLDDILQSCDFAPDIIKIDVEGFEVNVLKGADTVLSKVKPLLIIEVHPHHMDRIEHNPSMIQVFLRDRGYIIYSIDNHRSRGVSPLTKVHQINKTDDHVIVCAHENDSARRSLLTSIGLVSKNESPSEKFGMKAKGLPGAGSGVG